MSRLYFSNKKNQNYYMLSMEESLQFLRKDYEFDLNNYQKVPDERFDFKQNGVVILSEEELYRLKSNCDAFIREESGERLTRVNKDTREAPDFFKLDDVQQQSVVDKYADFVLEKNALDEFSYEDEDTLTIKFDYKNKTVEETIEFGEEVEVIDVDDSQIDFIDRRFLNDIRDNPFFKNLSDNVDDIKFVICEEVDKEDLCISIPCKDGTNLILSREEVEDYLDKYAENETIYTPPLAPPPMELAF